MALKRFYIDMPEEAVGHILNGIAGPQGYQAKIFNENGEEIDNPVTLTDFALGILKSDLMDKAKAFNLVDQERLAKIQITQRLEEVTAALLPFVTVGIEDIN
jgi:hypothetical protein